MLNLVTPAKQLLDNLHHSSSRNHGDSCDCGHRCAGHHLPGIICGISGCVPASLLPPSWPSSPLWFQVCTLWPRFSHWGLGWDHFALHHHCFSQLVEKGTLTPFHFLTLNLPHLRPTVDLIGAMETQSEPSELELDDVVITNPHIEAMLENEDWIEDAS